MGLLALNTQIRIVWLALAVTAALLQTGCKKEGCLGGESNCRVPSPCPKVAFTCAADAGALDVHVIEATSDRATGQNALAAKGDIKLSNGQVEIVISAIGHAYYLEPNGGMLLDVSPAGGKADGINNIFQATGVLPSDQAHYDTLEIIDERPTLVAVQVKGSLDGQPRERIITRYELGPCDPGVRVRTEIVNGAADPRLYFLVDGFYWGFREQLPFTPGVNEGFEHPKTGLLDIEKGFTSFPYLAASSHSGQQASYSATSCTETSLTGFNSETLSAAGLKKTIVPPRGYLVYERFIGVGNREDVAAAADIALEVRRQVTGSEFVTVSGTVTAPPSLTLKTDREASVLISEGQLAQAREARIPRTQVVPRADGTFSARVPRGGTYVAELHSFGHKVAEVEFDGSADAVVPAMAVPPTSPVTFTVQSSVGNVPLEAEVFLVPADDATKAAVGAGSVHGQFASCSPFLGPAPGPSPACNRVLIHAGTGFANVPLGTYFAYAYHGVFWTLARVKATFDPSPQTVALVLSPLALKPPNALSADLHVHGAASFDSSLPDDDRVLSFAASDIDVIIATDHDVLTDYRAVINRLGFTNDVSAVVGIESTSLIPFLRVPGSPYPIDIGHFNLWPLKYDPSLPYNGGPADEGLEPGELFERARGLSTSPLLVQLNHPWDPAEFGRDLGFPRAISFDATRNLPSTDDGTNMGLYVRSPKPGLPANNSHHAQEVMSGSDNATYLQHRAVWFYGLNQGLLRTGTANSDSHSLVDNTLGMPRNLVFTSTNKGPAFDVKTFNDSIRNGSVLGTNGPIIDAWIDGAAGAKILPGTKLASAAATASLNIHVTAAPWVPVSEIRVIVNGQTQQIVKGLNNVTDPFGSTDLDRGTVQLRLSDVLAGISGDAWIVVEAGTPLPLAADLGGGMTGGKDGIPDTTDNNGDGVVDQADVEAGAKIGPFKHPAEPPADNPLFHFFTITQGHPCAFTNPFVLDWNHDGVFTPPGVSGGRP